MFEYCGTSFQFLRCCFSLAYKPAVVNFSSIAGHRAQNPRRWTYSATKGAIKTLTQNMALELSKNNIRVNSISPGYIWTPEVIIALLRYSESKLCIYFN